MSSPKRAPSPWRRRLLIAGGGVAVAAGAAVLGRWPLMRWGLRSLIDNSRYPEASVSFTESAACTVTAESIEGPFFLANSPLRSDVRESQSGRRLRLQLKLVDALSCKPLAGAAVHIWQANAAGFYSGYPERSPDVVEVTRGHVEVEGPERFLRGHQITDTEGRVDFETIYPAWYSFRAPHIHLKALIDERTALTTQLYFPEAINTLIRETVAPYRDRPRPLVDNRSDPVIGRQRGAAGGWLKIVRGEDADVGSLTIGVAAPSAA